jgi:hypothetical protein
LRNNKENSFILLGLCFLLWLLLLSSLLFSGWGLLTFYWLWGLEYGASIQSESRVMITYLLDKVLAVKVSKDFSSHRSVDLELIAHDGNCERGEPWSFLGDSLI